MGNLAPSVHRLVIASFVLGASVCSASSITYTYTGNDFTLVQGPYTTSNFISGSFTTASPLGDNLADVDITSIVSTYSFTDGSINTITPSHTGEGPRFVATTNSQGNIVAWDVTLINGFPPTNSALFTCNDISGYINDCAGSSYDDSYEDNSAISGSNYSNPGTWTSTLNGFPGGPILAPVFLLSGPPVAEVTGTISGEGSQDYYTFLWGGGAFSATASVTGASGGGSYVFSEGAAGTCSSTSETLNSGDSFTGTISIPSLAAGTYCIGLDANSPNDPNFALTFNTPVEGLSTPEPFTSVLLAVGLGMLAVLRSLWRRRITPAARLLLKRP